MKRGRYSASLRRVQLPAKCYRGLVPPASRLLGRHGRIAIDSTIQHLASFAIEVTYDDLSAEVVHQVKRVLADTMACAAGGYQGAPAMLARQLAATTSSTTPARMLGTVGATAPDMAAFVNTVTARYIDCNDTYAGIGGHPSDMIGAILAVADSTKASGRDVVLAIALGYEVYCRLADVVSVGQRGFDQGALCILGSTAACGRLMGLTPDQMGNALAMAAVSYLPLGVIRSGELSMWKGCATAGANSAAVFSAQLAALGMTGPPAAFEDKSGWWRQFTGEPVALSAFGSTDGPWRIMNTSFKSYPAQIHIQGAISLAAGLRSQVKLADIASIHVESYRSAAHSSADPAKWLPKNRETADHSLPYLVAVALLDGTVTPAIFTDARIADPAVPPILAKMTVTENPAYTARFPQEAITRIDVTTTAGQHLVAETTHPKGHYLHPLADADIEAKFRELAAGTLTPTGCDAALAAVWGIDTAPSVTALLDAMVVGV